MLYMKKFSFLICFQLLIIAVFARQKVIDTTTLNNWKIIEGGSITNDGKFVHYSVLNWHTGENHLVIQSTKNKRKTEINNGNNVNFSENSQYIFFQKNNDTLVKMALKDFSFSNINSNVSNYELYTFEKKEIIVYKMNSSKVVIQSCENNEKIELSNVVNYKVSKDCASFISVIHDGNKYQLIHISLINGEKRIIWEGLNSIDNFTITSNGKQIAFKVNNSNDKFWLYTLDEKQNREITLDLPKDKNIILTEVLKFNIKENKLFIKIEERQPPVEHNYNYVDVWSYKDPKLQSLQIRELGTQSYLSIVNLETNEFLQLEKSDESISNYSNVPNDEWLFLTYKPGDPNEWNWNTPFRDRGFLINTNNGNKRSVSFPNGIISPAGKYYTETDRETGNIFSHEILTGLDYNVTDKLSKLLNDDAKDSIKDGSKYRFSIAGWLENDSAMIVYDDYDLWLLDPRSKNNLVCLTDRQGFVNNLSFRIAEGSENNKIYKAGNTLILDVFDNKSMKNGYYHLNISNPKSLKLLNMSSHIYTRWTDGRMRLTKARDNDIYLVPRCSSKESNNYFITSDFKKFEPLSNLHPEYLCKWLYSKLVHWKTSTGVNLKGILYLPQDFDSTKKYPVILTYYERRSNELNLFQIPGLTTGLLNIPWFVSRDYVVFVPDIYYTVGNPGNSILESITSAAEYISNHKWIDSAKMGLQGHSFSGFETNYVITHTTRFKAAVSGAGLSNLISYYGSILDQTASSAQFFMEISQCRIGGALTDRPQSYISNSPVLQLNNVTTPVLLMHNKEDGLVPISQGIEMFTGLRRLGKKAWLLQYANEGHQVISWLAAYDYTTRITQFFDYYLKNSLAPEWMSIGIPAKHKGEKSGFDLRSSDVIP